MSKIKVDGEFLDHGMLKSKSESAYDNHMVNAHGRTFYRAYITCVENQH